MTGGTDHQRRRLPVLGESRGDLKSLLLLAGLIDCVEEAQSRAEVGSESVPQLLRSWRGFRLPASHLRACSPPLHSTSMPSLFLSPNPPLTV